MLRKRPIKAIMPNIYSMRIRCQESDLADKIPISPTIIIIIRVYKEKLHEEK